MWGNRGTGDVFRRPMREFVLFMMVGLREKFFYHRA
jgi:hypothetical protein